MSDDNNRIFNIEDLDSLADTPEAQTQMSDDELNKLLSYLDDEPVKEYIPETLTAPDAPEAAPPTPPADMEATTVTDLSGILHGSTGTLPQDEATHVIPDDVRRVYDTAPVSPEHTGPVAPQEQQPEEKYDKRDYRAIHRDRRHRTGCLGGILYFLFVVCLSAALAFLGWIAANDVLALNKPEKTGMVVLPEEIFTVQTDEDGEEYTTADIDYVADELKREGFVDHPFLFKIFAKISHADKKVDPGEYELSTTYDFRALVAHMQGFEKYDTDETTLCTIPEGKTLKQTFELLEEAGVCKADDLWNSAANTDFDYWFLSDDTLGDERRLEGFLFPDTYEFWINMNPDNVLIKFLDNFNAKFTEEMLAAAEEKGMDARQIVTLASLIEMEAANDDERPTIASVIYNRLDSSDFPFLQIDASIQYILPERKERLSNSDLLIDDPYNTYMYRGLPPGPIANPGLASLAAALAPEETGYFFYALNKDGVHSFFEDYYSFNNFTNSSEYGG